MNQTQILTPISVCQSLPASPTISIKRDSILDGIETQLAGDTQILVLEGQEEAGKTTALAQFATRHESRSFALFVSSSSRWAYDPNQLRYDLCNQLEVFLHGRELEEISEASDAFLGTRILELLRRATRQKSTFYFIVDGLEEIPTEDETTRRMIVELLPFGLKGFRFLFSGSLGLLDLHPRLHSVAKTWFLTNFTIDESLRYFDGLHLSRDHVEEFHRTCRGMPGYLASVRRLLESGVQSERLIAELPARLPGLFEIEWRKVEQDNYAQRETLAFIAHERQRHTLISLSLVTGLTVNEIAASLSDLPFVVIDAAKGNEIRFVSESFRRFAAQELDDLRSIVRDKTIDLLSANPETDEAISLLPMYYKEADRLQDLLNFLSPQNFAKFLDRSPSVKLIRDKAELGIAAARALNRDGDLVRFSLHNATIVELGYSDASRSEVRALAALGDYDTAMRLAQGATRLEDRLHLLAAVARTRREQGLPIGPELEEQISELHRTVDYASLGTRAESIAGDLAHTNIELAIEAVDKATQASKDENELDWSLAKLAIQASIPQTSAVSRPGLRDITARIKDPLARRLSTEATLVLGRFSATEAIAEAARLDSTSDRLYVLRQWMLANRTNADAPEVLEYAVRIAVQTTGYSANAAVFRELATCLPYLKDPPRARHLVSVIGTHLGTIQQLGPTEDYVRLLLILARAEHQYDHPAAKNRLLDVYLEIAELPDLATRCACTARYLSTLKLIDPEKALEEKEKLHTMSMEDFDKQLDQLLKYTADHYEATKGIIRALAIAHPDLAIRVSQLLNTERRRNSALVEFVETAAGAPAEFLRPTKILEAVDLITEREKRDRAILETLELTTHRRVDTDAAQAILPLLDRAHGISDATKRGRACAISLSFLARHAELNVGEPRARLEQALQSSWESIDANWQKAELGFAVSADLAADRPDLARRYSDLASSFEHQSPLTDQRASLAAIMSVELAIRAFSGLLPRNLDTLEDIHRIERTIKLIPGAGPQAKLWAELAMRYQLNDRQAKCEEVVTKHVKPLLRALPENNEDYRSSITVSVAPALYAAFPASCLDTLDQLTVHDREEALVEICVFLLRRCPPADPFDYVEGLGYAITQETATEVCHLLHRLNSDSNIYGLLSEVVESILHPREPNIFSRLQKGEIARLVRDIAEKKFPTPGQIRHEGYRIAALAQASRLQQHSSKEWDSLVARARKIDNAADTAYVLSVIAPMHRDARKRRELVQEATRISDGIPTLLDRIDHYRLMSEMLMGVETGTSKQLLRTALALTLTSKEDKVIDARRSIIDMAHQIDPKFAEFLAGELNDDPARARIKRQLALLNLKRQFTAKERPQSLQTSSDKEYAKAAWMSLGALNARRVQPIQFETALEQVDRGSRQPISSGYPVFAWLIENAVRRYADKEAARKFVLPLFEAALLTAELVIQASSKTTREVERSLIELGAATHDDVITVGPNERKAAFAFITKWLESADTYIKVTEPYFDPSCLDLLRLIQEVRSDCSIVVLTSLKQQLEKNVQQPFADSYLQAWRTLTDSPAPDTEIVIAAVRGTNDTPIHDRWWITKTGGLELGTSWNSLGISKIAKVRVMAAAEAAALEVDVDTFAVRKTSVYGGSRVAYQTVLLGDA